jgi:predicted transcriptional regulator
LLRVPVCVNGKVLSIDTVVESDGGPVMSDPKSSAWQRRERSRDLTGLGWLEADVLRVVWDKGEVTVRDVYEALREQRRIAYTTVMSVLRNLAAKGLLEQDRTQAAYVYRPKVTDEEVARGILDALVDKIMGGRTEPLIDYLQQPRH